MTNVEDTAWRRPSGEDPDPEASPPSGVPYSGPPGSVPPPPGWRPEFVVQPPPPRELPQQDHSWLDIQEAAARTVTYAVGLVAGAIMLVAMLALCGRAWA